MKQLPILMALVWHGAGICFQPAEKFRTGEGQAGMALVTKGTGMMDRAAELEPKSIGVRIPGGSAYSAACRNMPPQMGQPRLEKDRGAAGVDGISHTFSLSVQHVEGR